MAEVQALKAQNMLYHEEEIYSRPKKTWFQTEKEKKELKGIYLFIHSFFIHSTPRESISQLISSIKLLFEYEQRNPNKR